MDNTHNPNIHVAKKRLSHILKSIKGKYGSIFSNVNNEEVYIGNISLSVESQSEIEHIPYPDHGKEYGFQILPSEILHHLQWMFKKAKLNQDMYLIGPPGPIKRWLAYKFCQLTNREIEYVSLTRDTSESDLKQRREIKGKSVVYIDQAAVRAAIHGRVLILEGIEKCERNILPILNNLLENREMHLEDGRFLVSPERFKSISNEDAKRLGLVPVSPKFLVIAIGLPTPKFEGNPLDPPLRSRFQARNISPPNEETLFSIISTLYPSFDRNLLVKLISFNETINRIIYNGSYNDASLSKILSFPSTGLVDIIKMLALFPQHSITPFLLRVYPFTLLLNEVEKESILTALFETGILENKGKLHYNMLSTVDDIYKLEKIEINRNVLFKNESGKVVKITYVGKSRHSISGLKPFYYTPFLQKQFNSIIQDIILKNAICLVGEAGSGKTQLIQQLCSKLNLSFRTLQLYKDINSRDILQKRSTDEHGNTIWIDSPLVIAALKGDLIILDNIHYLPIGTISLLQQLIHDGDITLFDKRRLVKEEIYEHLLSNIQEKHSLSQKDAQSYLDSKGIYPIHPAFRIIATAALPNRKRMYITSELISMFHFHILSTEARTDENLFIIRKMFPNIDENVIKPVFNFVIELENINKREGGIIESSEVPNVSLRQLIRIFKRITDYPEDIFTIIENTILIPFFPLVTRNVLYEIMQKHHIIKIENEQKKELEVTDRGTVKIGNIEIPQNIPDNISLVPQTVFYSIDTHMRVLYNMFKDWIKGEHLLLIGNQGVGKNVLTDHFLRTMNYEREYIQLHRDVTVQSLTLSPMIVNGIIEWHDSPLVKAVKYGRVLVIDEADKAPIEVVCIIKGLIEDNEMNLSDGRIISKLSKGENVIPIHPKFRMIVLSNRPGFPFLGNNFFRECGDVFSVHIVDNPDIDSEISLLKSYAPSLSDDILYRLVSLFADLREKVNEGILTYPYSLRELVNIVKHLEAYPNDSIISAINNVIHFDTYDHQLIEELSKIFHEHGLPISSYVQYTEDLGREEKLPQSNVTEEWKLLGEKESFDIIGTNEIIVKGKWPFEWGISHSNKSKTLGRIIKFTEVKMSWKVPFEVKTVLTVKSDVYIITSNPLQILKYQYPYSHYQILSFSEYIHIYYSDIVLNMKDLHVMMLKDYKILLYLSQYHMGIVVDLETKEIHMTEIPIDSNIFNTFGKKAYLNRDLRHSNNSLYSVIDTLSKDNIVLFVDNNSGKIFLTDFNNMKIYQFKLPFRTTSHNIYLLDKFCWLVRSTIDLKFLVRWNNSAYNNFTIHKLEDTKASESDSSLTQFHNVYDYNDNSFFTCFYTFMKKSLKPIQSLTKTNESIIITSSLRPSNDRKETITSLPLHKTNQLLNIFKKYDFEDYDIDDPRRLSYGVEIINFERNSVRPCHYILNKKDEERDSTLQNNPFFIKQATEMENSDVIILTNEGIISIVQVDLVAMNEDKMNWKKLSGDSNKEEKLSGIRYSNSKIKPSTPKFGVMDGKQHVGGGKFAGGSGGADTAGMGGVGGFMRLDGGHPIYEMTPEEKKLVDEKTIRSARMMAKKGLEQRLASIEMSKFDFNRYNEIYLEVKDEIKQLRAVLDAIQAKSKERVWLKNQLQGEIDENRLVDGLTGEKTVYKTRAKQKPDFSFQQEKPKLLRFVMDVSGSMARFNSQDHRLDRLLQCTLMIMESLKDFEDKFEYSIIGHSGDSPEIPFVTPNNKPKNEKERFKVLEKMAAHSSFCSSGDYTLKATEFAVNEVKKKKGDEYYVFVFSDANLGRYNIRPEELSKIMLKDPKVNTHIIFIASPSNEAERIKKELPLGKSHVCLDTSKLPSTFKQIFAANALND